MYGINEGCTKWINLNDYIDKNNKIQWKSLVGKQVEFRYKTMCGYIEILNYSSPYLAILYEGKKPYKIRTGDFTRCKLGNYLNYKTS